MNSQGKFGKYIAFRVSTDGVVQFVIVSSIPCFGIRTNKIVFAADISKDAMGPMPACGTGPPEISQLWAPLGCHGLENEI